MLFRNTETPLRTGAAFVLSVSLETIIDGHRCVHHWSGLLRWLHDRHHHRRSIPRANLLLPRPRHHLRDRKEPKRERPVIHHRMRGNRRVIRKKGLSRSRLDN